MGLTNRVSAAIVLVGWDRARTIRSCEIIDAWVKERGINCSKYLVMNRPLGSTPSGYETLLHDNSGLDIGAMIRGISRSRSDEDIIVLCNDRLPEYESDRPVLSRSDDRVLSYVASGPVLAGKLHEHKMRIRVGGASGSTWIQTHCLLISRELLESVDLNRLSMEASQAVRFTEDGALWSPHINKGLRNFIEHGLFSDRPQPRMSWRWHSAAKYGESDLIYLSQKAASIIAERALSAEVLRKGGILLDVASGLRVHRARGIPLLYRLERVAQTMVGRSQTSVLRTMP